MLSIVFTELKLELLLLITRIIVNAWASVGNSFIETEMSKFVLLL